MLPWAWLHAPLQIAEHQVLPPATRAAPVLLVVRRPGHCLGPGMDSPPAPGGGLKVRLRKPAKLAPLRVKPDFLAPKVTAIKGEDTATWVRTMPPPHPLRPYRRPPPLWAAGYPRSGGARGAAAAAGSAWPCCRRISRDRRMRRAIYRRNMQPRAAGRQQDVGRERQRRPAARTVRQTSSLTHPTPCNRQFPWPQLPPSLQLLTIQDARGSWHRRHKGPWHGSPRWGGVCRWVLLRSDATGEEGWTRA